MTRGEFTKFVRDLCYYHQRRMPEDRTVQLWFDDVQSLPAQRLPEIFNRLKTTEFPYNLPKAMFELMDSRERNAGNYQAHDEEDAYERKRYTEAARRFDALTNEQRRQAMRQVSEQFGVSERFEELKSLIRCYAIWELA